MPHDAGLANSSTYLVHTMGSLLALTSRTYAESAWQPYRDLPSFTNGGVNIVHGEATRVDVKNKTITYNSQATDFGGASKEMPYDYLIVTTGLDRSWPITPVCPTKHEYMAHTDKYARELQEVHGDIIIVGGGKFSSCIDPVKTLTPL